MRGTPTQYFQSLNRSFNVFGVDRQLFYLFVALCLPIFFAGHFKLYVDLIAGSLFVILHAIGVLITKADQQILKIYQQHIHYRKYYAPVSGIHAKVRLIKPSVPYYEGKRGLV